MSETSRPPLIAGLLSPNAYSHAVRNLRVRETHISWVVLTGEFAYKIKKPVNLGFADFSTLGQRCFFCQEELRLNRRYASDLYLDVTPITQEANGLRVDGRGEPVEYAVRMRQFDERLLLSQLLADGKLQREQIDELALVVAAAHNRAPCADEATEWGTAAQIGEPIAENFESLRSLVVGPALIRQIGELADWSWHQHQQLTETFTGRRRDGFIRECHGDLHLGNVVLWRGKVTPFDCIEFNPGFRWIDVMNEVAFVVMDLDDHARSDFARRFLNAYLERTGDYAGLKVLPFYLVYRAVVRAKVGALRVQQAGLAGAEQQRLTAEWHGYLDLAQRYTASSGGETPNTASCDRTSSRPASRPLCLTITYGLSGSGKTMGTERFIEQQGAIRLRSDVERKRLFGVEAEEPMTASVDGGIYSPAANERTYDRLAELAQDILRAGFSAIVDATFLKRAQRRRFQQLAAELGVPFQILAFDADEKTLRQRIRQRHAKGSDASDATVEVLERQLRAREPLTDDERSVCHFTSRTGQGANSDT